MNAAWIWLPEEAYPDRQETDFSPMAPAKNGRYTVAEFSKTWHFSGAVRALTLTVSGDTAFRLYGGGRLLLTGPATPGGDFLNNDKPRQSHYAYALTVPAEALPEDGTLTLAAQVRMMPVRICEYSRGHGGFFLEGTAALADNTQRPIGTDAGWSARLLAPYAAPGVFDGTLASEKPMTAAIVKDLWQAKTAPIPPCTLEKHAWEKISLEPKEKRTVTLPLKAIMAGYVTMDADVSEGTVKVRVFCRETKDDHGSEESLCFAPGKTHYQGFELHSAGLLTVEMENTGDHSAAVTPAFTESYYPVTRCARTVTSDRELNDVWNTCVTTLKCCRQTHHLDSPRHCEPLACTGDYYIETLMTAFSYGDLRLAAFDVRRTAELLRYNDGRMFHTTYSLIWVQMLWDTYFLTGEKALLTDCLDALRLLFRRFQGYLGENGLIETPPDYMFIDWLFPDGMSLHHPPKALGQTCLNLFYFGALQTAEKIFAALEEPTDAENAKKQKEKARQAITEHLWDPEKQLFFEGLNTPTPASLLGTYMPPNTDKRYYRMHANILAAYFGFFPKEQCADLLKRILEDPAMEPVQPYFMHFLLEAVYRNGLRKIYTLPLLEQWKAPIRECPTGLPEGFYKPEPTYSFDHSHAWGGTPAYALPLALSGLELLTPGFEKIRLHPNLLGLDEARVEIPAPQGMIVLELKKGEKPKVTLPEGIAYEIKEG